MNSLNQRPRRSCSRIRRLGAVVSFVLASSGCPPQEAPGTKSTKVPHLPLEITIPPGWVQDLSGLGPDPAKGGAIFKLVRESAVPGSPRIEFSLTPLTTRPPMLQDLVRQAARHMSALQRSTGFVAKPKEHQEITFAGQQALRLHQSYSLGSQSTEVAVSQFSIVTIVGKRGLIITIAGRTELTTPLESEIESLLKSAK